MFAGKSFRYQRMSRWWFVLLTQFVGMLACSLGQCMAGLCTTFETFIVCQGLVFGIGECSSQELCRYWLTFEGLGLVSRDLRIPTLIGDMLTHIFSYIPDSSPFPATARPLVRSQTQSCTSKRASPVLLSTLQPTNRSQGLANSGSGLGGLILSNTTRLMIDRLSVKYSLIINGAVSAGVLIPCILLMKPRQKETGARSEPLQVSWLVHRGFVWVWIWGGLASTSHGLRKCLRKPPG